MTNKNVHFFKFRNKIHFKEHYHKQNQENFMGAYRDKKEKAVGYKVFQ